MHKGIKFYLKIITLTHSMSWVSCFENFSKENGRGGKESKTEIGRKKTQRGRKIRKAKTQGFG